MRTRHSLTLALVAACGAAVAGAWTARWLGSTGSPTKAISAEASNPLVTPDDGNVGEVWESDAAVVRLPVRNPSDRVVRIIRLSGDCRVIRVEPASCELPPRGETVLEVTLNLTERSPLEAALLSRAFSAEIRADVEGRLRPVSIPIRGTCRCWVAASTLVLNFGEANVAGSPPVSRTATVVLRETTDALSATSSSDLIRACVRPGSDGGIQLIVTPDTDRLRGPFSGRIRLDVTDTSQRPKGGIAITVEGTIREPARLRPPSKEPQP